MKVTALLLLSVFMISVSCLETYHFYHGDQLLNVLQEKNGKVFVIMVAKDDTKDKNLAIQNARVADALYHQVLTKQEYDADGKPVGEPEEKDVVWARLNADDHYRNDHFAGRLKIDVPSLEDTPTVIVMKNQIGWSMHGPTAVRHAMRHVDELLAAQ